MAYKKEELEKKSLEAIEKYKLFFNEDIISYLPCSAATFYNHELEKLESIKDALTKVKTEIKVSMRSKWYKSENATLQMGLMKLIGSDEERRRLSQTHTDITTDGKSLNTPLMNLDPLKIKE
jgi:hypothetical protein